MAEPGADFRFITAVIQTLDLRFGIRFFITTRDFDVLYRWFEKGIPLPLVTEALAAVVERRKKRGRPVAGLSVFAYEVRRRYQAFLTMQGAGERRLENAGDVFSEIREYLTKYPEPLAPLKPEMERCFSAFMEGRPADFEPLRLALLDLFAVDEELAAKCDFFMRNLAPALRKPELERTYRLNWLIRRYKIPLP